MNLKHLGLLFLILLVFSGALAAIDVQQGMYRWRNSGDDSNLAEENEPATTFVNIDVYLAVLLEVDDDHWQNKYVGLRYSKDGGAWTDISFTTPARLWNDGRWSTGYDVETYGNDLWDPDNGHPSQDSQYVDYPFIFSDILTIGAGYDYELHFAIKFTETGTYQVKVVEVTSGGSYVRDLDTYSEMPEITITEVTDCGNGECGVDEDYSTCPEDCCDSDCTATEDSTCHSECNGYNDCSIIAACDDYSYGLGICLSQSERISCCESIISCGAGEYCSDGSCNSCSTICDGLCQSSACYNTDPDCDTNGELQECCKST